MRDHKRSFLFILLLCLVSVFIQASPSLAQRWTFAAVADTANVIDYSITGVTET